jgi:large subunit ribosomal protein L10
MARPDKAAAVAELAEEFRSSNGAVLTEYRGLSVKQLQELRRSLGDTASYSVVKNTLTRIAARDAGIDVLDDLLVGPSAIAFIKGDPVEAAKGLRNFARANAPLVIKGGVLDGKSLTPDEIARFADLESREVLLAKLAGAMTASLSGAASLFSAPVAQAARLLAALQAKAEEDPSVLAADAGAQEPAESPAPAAAAPEVGTDATATSDASAGIATAEQIPAGEVPASEVPVGDLPAGDAPGDDSVPTDA